MKKIFTTALVISIISAISGLLHYEDWSLLSRYGPTIAVLSVGLFLCLKSVKFNLKDSMMVGFLSLIFCILLYMIAVPIMLKGLTQTVQTLEMYSVSSFLVTVVFLVPPFILKIIDLFFSPGYFSFIVTNFVYIVLVAAAIYVIPRFRKA